jgi:cell division protein FtsN
MSLRHLVIFLLIANLGYFGYSQGWLKAIIDSDAAQREPERLSRQVNPTAINVSLATKAEAPIVAASTFSAAPIPPVQAAAEQVATCASKREQWVVYMGPYTSKTLADKKKTELSGLGVDSSGISKPNLKIGLSLGQFENEIAAREALTKLSTKGVKTATVVLWASTDCPPN